MEYVEVVIGLTFAVPDVAPPVKKPPAAEHDVAPVEFQASVEVAPFSMFDGFAKSEAVGAEAVMSEQF
jgi:hypothetical protein